MDNFVVQDIEHWQQIISVRNEVIKELEHLRVSNEIGSSLDAEVDIYCDDATRAILGKIQEELRFVLITSYARLHDISQVPSELKTSNIAGMFLAIEVKVSKHAKCMRCWHHREDVGNEPSHADICSRCVDNIEGDGEVRRHC